MEKEQEIGIPDVPIPPADGPKLGAIANLTPIYDRPSKKQGNQLGYLHAGARVPRAKEAFSTRGCASGWYPIAPKGFVCAEGSATLDMDHPTLQAMAIQPDLKAVLPYTYARSLKKTVVYEVDAEHDKHVRPVAELPSVSGLAVVGSWTAKKPDGEELRLAMMADGRFVDAALLRAADPSEFSGVELSDELQLPVGYIVKRGVRAWFLDEQIVSKRERLDYHKRLELTGRFRSVRGVQFWALSDGRWVRHKDITIIRKRSKYPVFATGDQKWVDVSVITGTATLYEGRTPVFVTLVTVGRDRLGDPKNSDSTARGEFNVVGKHITATASDPKGFANNVDIFDTPWVLELDNGQLMHGAYWHDRFGIEHGPGNIQLSVADAKRVWQWATPTLPGNWHGQTAVAKNTTIINVRK
ncbi:MAG: L,D-transpeptidase [Polyangiaceae bacterium]|nr:L,D-transpeptidase [Polyangiaceae bacterium]